MQTSQHLSQLPTFTGLPVRRHSCSRSKWRRGGWLALCLVATLLGLVSLSYLLPHVPFPIRNSNFALRRPWLVAHVVSASVALIVGTMAVPEELAHLAHTVASPHRLDLCARSFCRLNLVHSCRAARPERGDCASGITGSRCCLDHDHLLGIVHGHPPWSWR